MNSFPQIIGRKPRHQRWMIVFAFVFGWLTMWLYSIATKEELTRKDELRITRQVVNDINGAANYQARQWIRGAGRE